MRRARIDGYTLAVVDLLTALVVVFAAMAVLAILAAQRQRYTGVTQGDLVVTVSWHGSPDADVDLYVRAPGDSPVGYSHKEDTHCDLLKDDLGATITTDSEAREMVICRGIPDGEWVVDAMLFEPHDARLPVPVTATVLRIDASNVTQWLRRSADLTHKGQQITLWRFRTRGRQFVRGSVNELPVKLYGAQ